MKNGKLRIKAGFFLLFLVFSLAIFSPSYFPALLSAITLHEFGHWLFAKLCKIQLSELKLGIFGAVLYMNSELISYKKEILVCLGGPMMNFISALFISIIPFPFDTSLFLFSSLALGILNLLPITGFDGGRILSALLKIFLPLSISELILKLLSFILLFSIWCMSVYLLLKVAASLSLFVFSIATFVKIFIPNST